MASTQNTEPEEPPRIESNDPPPPQTPIPPPPSYSQAKTPKFDFPSFSQLLEGVVRAANSATAQQSNPLVVENVRLEVQFKMSHQEALACVTAKATESQVHVNLPTEQATSSVQTSPSTRNEPSLPPITTESSQSASSLENKVNNNNNTCQGKKKRKSFSQENSLSLPENKSNNAAAACLGQHKRVSLSNTATEGFICDTPRAPHSDGYCWRKYGQKQVKCPESSRSYYRCTHADCSAKKTVQHSDKSGQIIAVDYRGPHNHDPPRQIYKSLQKGNSFKKQTAAVESVIKTSGDVSSEQKLDDVLHKSSSGKEAELAMVVYDGSDKKHSDSPTQSKGVVDVAEMEQQRTADEVKRPEDMQLVVVNHTEPSNSSYHLMADVAKGSGSITGQKRRMKEKSKESPHRSLKEPKIVVHSAGDPAISSDGYRWRKYGQKMVKGNPNPRSYYRCTSAGCPVRKHVERAVDNSEAVVVSYEGKHDHDTPVPKKRLSYSISPSSVSCPVPPKHDERAIAIDNNSAGAIVVTYEGKVDPDTPPIPKNPLSCSPSTANTTSTTAAVVVSAVGAAGAADNNTPSSCPVDATTTKPSQVTLIEPKQEVTTSADEKKTPELGTEKKMLESAQTLLSIGIELKSC